MTEEFLRTPEERFRNLPEYPFTPRWFEWEGLRLHYLDEGDGFPAVLFHGEPTWSFMYRRLIPRLLEAGHRVIAPDYLGFGRSDKPADPAFYTYDRHTESVGALLEALELDGAVAVVHDWGGPIGLRLATESARFRRLVITNTALFGAAPSEGFLRWRAFVERTEDLPVGLIMERSAVTRWPPEVIAAYEAPFPDVRFKVGARQFPLIVPLGPDDPGAGAMARVKELLGRWTDPALVLFSAEDPIFGPPVAEHLAAHIPGAGEAVIVEHAGHFLFEDNPTDVARHILEFLS